MLAVLGAILKEWKPIKVSDFDLLNKDQKNLCE